jgi:DHA2 family multidrug resistance protein
VRNIGGSFGIAIVQTILARDRQGHINRLVSNVNPYDPAAQQMFLNLRSAFVSRGADLLTATNRAYAALWGMVQRQAAIQAFLDAFVLLAIIFLAMAPMVLLMRKPQHHEEPVIAPAD